MLLLQLLLLLVLLLLVLLLVLRSACIHCLYSTGVSLAAAGTTKALLLLLLQPSYFFCDSTALTNASKLLDPSYEKIAESSAVPCQFQRCQRWCCRPVSCAARVTAPACTAADAFVAAARSAARSAAATAAMMGKVAAGVALNTAAASKCPCSAPPWTLKAQTECHRGPQKNGPASPAAQAPIGETATRRAHSAGCPGQ